MEEAMAARYWCHLCAQVVNPIMEAEIKCPFCQSGFVEEMGSSTSEFHDSDSDYGGDRALSLWAPILLGMTTSPRRRRRLRRRVFEESVDEDDNGDGELRHRDEMDYHEFEAILPRRRGSTSIFQMLQGMRAGMALGSENSESDHDQDRVRERERFVLINHPFNQTIALPGSLDLNHGHSHGHIGPLGDYSIGPGLDMLLQHLAENDLNRYGTNPAQKEAVEALPTVKMADSIQCSVCLDDFEVGAEAKEMPCKHKFHSGCILPWLDLYSTCPVCRYQLPSVETKLDPEQPGVHTVEESSGAGHGSNEEEEDPSSSGRRFSFPWPFSGLFSSSSSGSPSNHNDSSSSASDSRSASTSNRDGQ